MSKIYIRLLAVAAFLIAVTGALFSIFGLTQLFAGAPRSVAVMAGSLEFAKLVVTGFLYRYWGHVNRPMRVYLTFAVVALVVITSLGIFGYLSNAYQVASLDMRKQEIQITSITTENERVQGQIKELRRFIDEIPRSRISRKFEFQKQYEPEIRRLQKRSDSLLEESEKLKLTMLKTHVDLGPLVYIAQAFGTTPDTMVKALIFLFVLVFDPLAICLVFCLNLAIRLREKYRGNEFKIAAHSLTTPVDHRHKKSA